VLRFFERREATRRMRWRSLPEPGAAATST
jgi:hypothetical protein